MQWYPFIPHWFGCRHNIESYCYRKFMLTTNPSCPWLDLWQCCIWTYWYLTGILMTLPSISLGLHQYHASVFIHVNLISDSGSGVLNIIWVSWRLKSPVTYLCVQRSTLTAFVGGISRYPWIPLQRTSNAERISMSWRPHETLQASFFHNLIQICCLNQ